MASKVKPEDFENWLTPKQALEVLESKFGTDSWSYVSKHTLLERLRGDIVEAVAGRSTRDAGNETKLTRVFPDEWHHVDENHVFWKSGDLTYRTKEDRLSEWISIRHFDVRFEPNEVRAIIGPAHKPQDAAAAEETQKGPPVSPAHLRAWFDLYASVYSDNQSEAHALRSARGMFADKSVSREAVRALRGPQKSGPKGPRDSGD